MISTKNTSIDTILNRKKNIMNILFSDINYKSKKITYKESYNYKIKKIKIKDVNFSRNVNNLKKKKETCIDTGYINDIVVENNTETEIILPDNKKLKDINGNDVVIKRNEITKYQKDILFYKYDNENEEEPDIDELTKIIIKEIEDTKNEMKWLSKMIDEFLEDTTTIDKYKKYQKDNAAIDDEFEAIIKEYAKIIQDYGL